MKSDLIDDLDLIQSLHLESFKAKIEELSWLELIKIAIATYTKLLLIGEKYEDLLEKEWNDL